jgi:hypothetical protein
MTRSAASATCSEWRTRIEAKVIGVLGLAACGGGSASNTKGSVVPMCHITLTGEVTEYVSIEIAKGQRCSTIAFAMQQEFYGATVTSDGSAKPFGSGWSAACLGTLTSADDAAFVIAQGGDDIGGVCSTLGFSASP